MCQNSSRSYTKTEYKTSCPPGPLVFVSVMGYHPSSQVSGGPLRRLFHSFNGALSSLVSLLCFDESILFKDQGNEGKICVRAKLSIPDGLA